MIQLIPRKEALKKNKVLARYILDIQKTTYAPELFEPGENWIEEEEKWIVLTQEECSKRNKPILAEFESIIDKLDLIPGIKEFTDESLLSSQEHNEAHGKIMAKGLEKLNKILDWKGILFIPEFPYSWLEFVKYKDEEHSRVENWFFNKGADKNFNGAVYASGEDLREFIQLLTQFIARSQYFPICRFTGVNSAAIGSVCKYGNIHYLFYKEDEFRGFENALRNTQLEKIPFGSCEYKF